MSAQRLDGKAVSLALQQSLAKDVAGFVEAGQRPPGLAVILVGDDPASSVYVAHKQKACERVGIQSMTHHLPASTTMAEIEILIGQCNQNDAVDGILLQLPLPGNMKADALLDCIHPSKDVDGFHPHNMGLLLQRRPALRSCTPWGVMRLLAAYDIDVRGMDAVIVGASNIVGRPMALELLLARATPTVCHRFTKNLAEKVAQADLLVAAMGSPGVIQADWIKPGAILVDVGITRLPNGKLTGDLPFDQASERASWITPVPGGVGPMTVAILMENTVAAYRLRQTRVMR